MTVHRLADEREDPEGWLAARTGLMTSSNFFTFNDKMSSRLRSWWSDTPDSLLREKLEGIPKDFPGEARVSMQHGILDEQNIQRKFGIDVGAETLNDHGLYKNDKWSHLGASIDGFVYRPNEDDPYAGPRFTHHTKKMLAIREMLLGELEPDEGYLCEIKKSTSSKWQTEVPEYYLPQLQGQMHILDITTAIIVAECIVYLKPEGERRKRAFWDLQPYVVRRDEEYAEDMHEMNERWLSALTAHGVLGE